MPMTLLMEQSFPQQTPCRGPSLRHRQGIPVSMFE
jgi:hypothetical protein